MNKPLVSVVLPTYERPGKLGRAIDSVINQRYTNWELFVVDDNDKFSVQRTQTEKFMSNYKDNDRINYLKHEKNRGGATARNTGIKKSNGEYIAFLDDDDIWLENKLYLQVNSIRKLSEDWGGVYCNRFVKNNNSLKETHNFLKGNLTKELLLFEIKINTSALLIKKTVFKDIGCFDTTFKRNQDWEFLIRFFRKYKLGLVEKPLVIKESHSYANARDVEKTKIKYLKKFRYIIDEFSPKIKNKIYARNYLLISLYYLKENEVKKSFEYFIKANKKSSNVLQDLFHFYKFFLY